MSRGSNLARRSRAQLCPVPKVTFVGAGSAVFARQLMTDILAIDGENVQGIECDQKKSYSYLYQ